MHETRNMVWGSGGCFARGGVAGGMVAPSTKGTLSTLDRNLYLFEMSQYFIAGRMRHAHAECWTAGDNRVALHNLDNQL